MSGRSRPEKYVDDLVEYLQKIQSSTYNGWIVSRKIGEDLHLNPKYVGLIVAEARKQGYRIQSCTVRGYKYDYNSDEANTNHDWIVNHARHELATAVGLLDNVAVQTGKPDDIKRAVRVRAALAV